jgi:hypothetical protein
MSVMGLSLPKTLTNALDSLVNSPRGRELLAGALVAAASAAAAALTKGSDRGAAANVRQAAAEAGNQVTNDISNAAAEVVAEMVGGAARALLPASLGGDKKSQSGT